MAQRTPVMSRVRHLLPVQRRLLMALVALAMVVRVLVPAGWMPVADASGAHLVLCDGGMVAPPMTMAETGAMAKAMTGAMTHGKAPMHHQGPSDHPCAFAGPVAAVETPQLVVPLAPTAPRHMVATVHLVDAVGRGLAAPPPPPTGPPAFV